MGTSLSFLPSAPSDLLQAKEGRLIQESRNRSNTDNGTKIEKSARDFESILVGTWLQQAEQSFATVPGSTDDDESAGREQMMSLGVQSLASSMAAMGGIGIAKMVAKSLHRSEQKENTQPPTAPGTQISPTKLKIDEDPEQNVPLH